MAGLLCTVLCTISTARLPAITVCSARTAGCRWGTPSSCRTDLGSSCSCHVCSTKWVPCAVYTSYCLLVTHTRVLHTALRVTHSYVLHNALCVVEINPATGQPDYSEQWAAYYRQMGYHDQADAILKQAQQQSGQAPAQ